MNAYKNLLNKVKVLLKEDDNLTKEQCEAFQWQLLIKSPKGRTFTVGKGGVNTIFYSASSTERGVCYPDEILEILEPLTRSKVYMYLAMDKKKKELGYSYDPYIAKKFEGAHYVVACSFKDRKEIVLRKAKGLFDDEWLTINEKLLR